MSAPTLPAPSRCARWLVRVRGSVQGVGFRPFVHAQAQRLGLAGTVVNDGDGVLITVEGPHEALAALVAALRRDAPPLARIESIEHHAAPLRGLRDFHIVASRPGMPVRTQVPADVATCADCLRELFDPADRRAGHPFISCTNCGPRYTLIEALPYDRARTTMASFAMCAACAAEYSDPTNRRHHAEPIACHDCGPQLAWVVEGRTVPGNALAHARAALASGMIVAVKGIGGFHLACDAANHEAVQRLRVRKRRPAKPLAVLAASLDVVRTFARVRLADATLLQSPAHPIVLLDQLARHALSPAIAPGQRTVGVMLPYSPLHHLLAADGPLVLTSGNLSDEPIVRTNEEALARLAPLVDAFLLHDRAIHVVCDDSVMRTVEQQSLPLRRSRGYAPYPVALPAPVPAILAVGGELKATACLTRDRHAFLTPHIGDVGSVETEAALARACAHLEQLLALTPAAIACDLHPGYRSTAWARMQAGERGLPLHQVQHHHAHLASLLAEHGMTADATVLGFTFDGTGYGPDGTIWGGEVLLGGYATVRRVAHLGGLPLPGGDAGVRWPARLALAALHRCGLPWDDAVPSVAAVDAVARRVLAQQLERRLQVVETSSMGRLLDVVASLCGVRQEVEYEGQAAIELEVLASRAGRGLPYELPLHTARDGAPMQWAVEALLAQVVRDVLAGRDRGRIARGVFDALVVAMVAIARQVRAQEGVARVGLTGGVFQNVLLLRQARAALRADGFEVLVHTMVPPNDGGLALGQAMVATHAATFA